MGANIHTHISFLGSARWDGLEWHKDELPFESIVRRELPHWLKVKYHPHMYTHSKRHTHTTPHIETYLYISQSCGFFMLLQTFFLSESFSFKCAIAEKPVVAGHMESLILWIFVLCFNLLILAILKYRQKNSHTNMEHKTDQYKINMRLWNKSPNN